MRYALFNRSHFIEYIKYGSIAGVLHVLTVWYFLHKQNDQLSPVLFIGSIFFMLVILIYAVKLVNRQPEKYSTWTMIIAGQITVIIGILVSITGSILLCTGIAMAFHLPPLIQSSGLLPVDFR